MFEGLQVLLHLAGAVVHQQLGKEHGLVGLTLVKLGLQLLVLFVLG